MLARVGTQAFLLPPGAIVSAARADIARRIENKFNRECGNTDFETYAFLAKHVRRAQTEAHLILLALTAASMPLKCTKPNTILLYRDAGALIEALFLADCSKGPPQPDEAP